MFEECGEQRTTEACLSYKLTDEPSAQLGYKSNFNTEMKQDEY